jgi:hypothetical protein
MYQSISLPNQYSDLRLQSVICQGCLFLIYPFSDEFRASKLSTDSADRKVLLVWNGSAGCGLTLGYRAPMRRVVLLWV